MILGKQLGSGAYGIVFKARIVDFRDKHTPTDVAVKTVSPNSDLSCIKALEAELQVMIRIGNHLNVVNLLGVSMGNIDKSKYVLKNVYDSFNNIE